MGPESINNYCNKPDKILDSTCDSLSNFKNAIQQKNFPEKKELDGKVFYEIGGDFGDISENELGCFLVAHPNIGLTELGLADVLKNHPTHRINGKNVKKQFIEERNGESCKNMM